MKIENTVTHLNEMFNDNGKPNNITCDNQFNTTKFNDFVEKEEIKLYFTQPDEINKNSFVERFNKTLSLLLQKWRIVEWFVCME